MLSAKLCATLVTIALANAPLPLTAAHAACDASSNPAQDCLDGFKGAVKEVFTSNDDVEKSKSVGQAAGDCIKCAAETLSDQVRQFGSSENGQ